MHSVTHVHRARARDHAVLFYRDDQELTVQVSDFLLAAIQDKAAAIVIAGPGHRICFEERLAQAGVNIPALSAAGLYLPIDASDLMCRFMKAGWPDPASFWQAMSPLARQPADQSQPVRIYGEMVALLWDAGLVSAAIDVESLWDELGGQYTFSLLCGYPAHSVGPGDHADALAEVCRLHDAVIGTVPEPDQAQSPGH